MVKRKQRQEPKQNKCRQAATAYLKYLQAQRGGGMASWEVEHRRGGTYYDEEVVVQTEIRRVWVLKMD